MKGISIRTKRTFILSTIITMGFIPVSFAGEVPSPTANGISFPINYQDWAVISVSHREDNQTLRAIIGNPAAIEAAKEGNINPWPNGATLGKLVWKGLQREKNYYCSSYCRFLFYYGKCWRRHG